MIIFPCAKINLGLNIVSRRPDGYHNLETVFYPIPLYDALEVKKMDERFPSDVPCDIKVTGNTLDANGQDNLIVKAYNLLSRNYELPRVHVHLYKHIPTQAGLGGGSSDAAFMIKFLDERFRLNMGNAEMERYAAMLGADCAFFISAEPSFATGIGNELSPADGECGNLHGYYMGIVKPPIAVSTAEAYAKITPKQPSKCCRDIVRQPISTWKDELINDFEEPIFSKYPELADIKSRLYGQGALYAQMSGSGSALFGIFKNEVNDLSIHFPDCFTESFRL
jgi:4-diphosphocytidyl-2-C-methyl-D-erythritol kinase